MQQFKLILGTPLSAVPRPWLSLAIPGVMVSAYEIFRRRDRGELRGRGLRRLLGLDDGVELWIDSGGYQFLKKNVDPGVDRIARLYREIDADYYISLDYPPSPRDEPGLRAAKIARTIRMYLKLRSMLRGIAEEGRLVPVFHLATGPSLRLQLECYSSTAVTAAVGGLVPYFMQLAGRYSRLKAVIFLSMMRRLWRGHLHALGLASAAVIPLLKALRINSSDTQTWRHKAAFGKIIIPGLGERHVSGREVRFGPAKLRENEIPLFMEYVSKVSPSLGIRVEELSKSFEARAVFNAWSLLQVASNGNTYWGTSPAFANLYKAVESLLEEPLEKLEQRLEEMLAQGR
ncbi:MAG: hypothetical protein ABWW69_02140, partial [Pyrodictiaceae archaeon]